MRIIGNNPAADNAEITAVASGTLPSGQPVIVNANGTVSVVVAGASGFLGETIFESAHTSELAGAFDSNANSLVISYKDEGNSNYPTVIAGVVSGSSISFGTPTIIESYATSESRAVVFDSSNNKVAIAYRGGPSALFRGVVATASGTSISLGSVTQLQSKRPALTTGAFDSTNNKVVITYSDAADTSDGQVFVCTISGTSISAGSIVTFDTGGSGGVTDISTVFDSNAGKIVISYRDPPTNESSGVSIVGTVSGTSISFGSKVVFETSYTYGITSVFDSSSNKIIIAYRDAYVTGNLIVVGTVSGTSISFGTAYRFNTVDNSHNRLIFDTQTNKPILFYKVNGATELIGSVVNVSGTSVSLGTPLTLDIYSGSSTSDLQFVWDSTANKIVIVFADRANSDYGTSGIVAFPNSNLTAENFIGFSPGSVGIESRTQAVGSETVFEAASSSNFGSTFDTSNNKVVFSYTDAGNSNKGTAIVGTISDTSISFGSAVEFEQGATESHAATFDTNSNKVVLAYRDRGNSDYGTAIVGTVSGTNISFGSAVAFVSSNSDYIKIAFDSNSNKVVISYVDLGDSNKGKAIVGTVSGTNISFGSATEFESGSTQLFANPAFDSSNNKIVIPYKDLGNSNYGTAVVGTVSGTSISFGTPVVFAQGETRDIGIDFDTTNNKVVIAYKNESGSNYGTSIVGTVSGTSISFGTAVVYQSSDSRNNNVTFDPSAKTSTITYQNQTSSEVGQFVVGTISGTSISFTSATTFTGSNAAFFMSTTLDSNSNRLATAFYDQSNSNYGTSVILKTGFTTITRDEVASGSKATIDIGSAISTNQLSLTAGQQYFVQGDGTLGLTAADPSVIAGTAVSATDIIVKG